MVHGACFHIIGLLYLEILTEGPMIFELYTNICLKMCSFSSICSPSFCLLQYYIISASQNILCVYMNKHEGRRKSCFNVNCHSACTLCGFLHPLPENEKEKVFPCQMPYTIPAAWSGFVLVFPPVVCTEVNVIRCFSLPPFSAKEQQFNIQLLSGLL